MSRDPRMRGRTASNSVANPAPPVSHALERQGANQPTKSEAPAVSETDTPQTTQSNDQNPHLARGEASDLEKTFLEFVSSAVETGLTKRKREYLRREAETARGNYEHCQRAFAQFPVVVEQALEKQKMIDSEYEYTQQKMRRCTEAENMTTSHLVRRLFDLISKDNEQARYRSAELDDLRTDFDAFRSQVASKPEVEKAADKLAELVTENDALRKRVNTLQDMMPAITQENETLRKSVHILQDRVKLIEQNTLESAKVRQQALASASQTEISLRNAMAEVKADTQRLSDGLTRLEKGSDEFESVKKSSILRMKNLQTRIEDVEGKMTALQNEVSSEKTVSSTLHSKLADLEGEVEALGSNMKKIESSSVELRDNLSAIQHTDTESADRIEGLQRSLESLIRDCDLVRDDVSALKAEDPMSLAHGISEDLDAQLQRLDDKIEKSISATTRADAARDKLLVEEIERINQDLSDRIDTIQQGLTEVERASKAEPSVPSLSAEDRHMLDNMAGLVPKLHSMEADLGKVQKALEKNTHMIQWQTHRFDNLSSETLSRQMVGVISPIIPKFEQGLVKIEADVGRLWKRLEHSSTKLEDAPSECKQQVEALEEKLLSAKADVKSEYELLAREFRETRDNITASLDKVGDSQSRAQRELAAYRSSTDQRIAELEDEIHALRRKWSRRDDSPRSIHEKAGVHQKVKSSRKVPEELEELDAEEMGKEASTLLESFQNRPARPSSQTLGRKVVSLKVGAATQPSAKRKRLSSPASDIDN